MPVVQTKSLHSRKIKSKIGSRNVFKVPRTDQRWQRPSLFSERQLLKYQGGVNVEKLIADAQSELAESQPEQFKILLLGAMAGLRRREIDLLEWDSCGWKGNAMKIKPTCVFEVN